MKLIASLQRLIDREWIKANWIGQTLAHKAIAISPIFLAVGLAELIEARSLRIAVFIIGVGLSIVLTLWIALRQLAASGSFSTARSERFARRYRGAKDNKPDAKHD